MALIVETGTANPLADAYASKDYCDLYHENFGNLAWAAIVDDDLKEQAIRRAAMFMCQSYRALWKGYRVSSLQMLDWPRYDVTIDDLGTNNTVSFETIPDLVLRANAELALIAAAGDLNPTIGQNVLSKQIGPIKVVYDTSFAQGKKYVAVLDILRPLFSPVGGVSHRLRRT